MSVAIFASNAAQRQSKVTVRPLGMLCSVQSLTPDLIWKLIGAFPTFVMVTEPRGNICA